MATRIRIRSSRYGHCHRDSIANSSYSSFACKIMSSCQRKVTRASFPAQPPNHLRRRHLRLAPMQFQRIDIDNRNYRPRVVQHNQAGRRVGGSPVDLAVPPPGGSSCSQGCVCRSKMALRPDGVCATCTASATAHSRGVWGKRAAFGKLCRSRVPRKEIS